MKPFRRNDARACLRLQTRALLRDRHDGGAHLARLHGALRMPGTEPVQGVLADLFVAMSRHDARLCESALQIAGARLNRHVLQAFERHVRGPGVFRITPLATRWSVIAHPSADVPARIRRASPDDSRRMAREVVDALNAGDPGEATHVERRFLDHCLSCHDKLAFMLATRDLRRLAIDVDARWMRVAAWLADRDAAGAPMPAERIA